MQRACERCGKVFAARRSTARYCSGACRSAADKARRRAVRRGEAPPAPVVTLPSAAVAMAGESVEVAVRRELGSDAGSALGAQALLLARRLDRQVDTSGSAVATLSRQLQALMHEAVAVQAARGADGEDGDALDFVQRRARERREEAAGA